MKDMCQKSSCVKTCNESGKRGRPRKRLTEKDLTATRVRNLKKTPKAQRKLQFLSQGSQDSPKAVALISKCLGKLT